MALSCSTPLSTPLSPWALLRYLKAFFFQKWYTAIDAIDEILHKATIRKIIITIPLFLIIVWYFLEINILSINSSSIQYWMVRFGPWKNAHSRCSLPVWFWAKSNFPNQTFSFFHPVQANRVCFWVIHCMIYAVIGVPWRCEILCGKARDGRLHCEQRIQGSVRTPSGLDPSTTNTWFLNFAHFNVDCQTIPCQKTKWKEILRISLQKVKKKQFHEIQIHKREIAEENTYLSTVAQ